MTGPMTYKGYTARVEYDEDDRILVGHIDGIDAIVGFHGETVAEPEGAFHEAVDDYLEWHRDPAQPQAARR